MEDQTVKNDLPAVKRWTLILYGIGGAFCVPGFGGFVESTGEWYHWVKLLHIVGAILFLGNITVGPLWMMIALKTKNIQVIFYSMRGLLWADIFFTIPGILLLLITGPLIALTFGGYTQVSWILGSLLLLGLMMIPSFVILVYQYRLYTICYEGIKQGELDWAAFNKAFSVWSVFGMLVMIEPLLVLGFMVLKPDLW